MTRNKKSKIKKTGNGSDLIAHSITIKYLGTLENNKQYQFWLDAYCEAFPHIWIDAAYENDKNGVLHVHGTFVARRDLTYRPLFVKNYHVYCEPKTSNGWTGYVGKDREKRKSKGYLAYQEQLVYEKYARANYLFHDCYKECIDGVHSYLITQA